MTHLLDAFSDPFWGILLEAEARLQLREVRIGYQHLKRTPARFQNTSSGKLHQIPQPNRIFHGILTDPKVLQDGIYRQDVCVGAFIHRHARASYYRNENLLTKPRVGLRLIEEKIGLVAEQVQ